MHFDEDLDCEGLICPLPVLRVRKRLMAMAPGAVLRVSTTDPMAVIDLPHFCAETGHEVLSRDGRGPLTLWHIRRNARGV
ncbi:tRNA 2-thiouridine synthesizing protein A [Cereibacter ovatus]|uniref:tRNA 2-thiouridine synthesizing protein A n=1 Tax=Cereibacter ovatus TaxID=439529 RepID=A0A285CQJ6_9RHOB|nr:sulfurtransferase TusA family protein [Cereibacter ovatus]SNX69338.1 tRNA 2-thiouridine synthesizing protein A [Cereibacter ovatus]